MKVHKLTSYQQEAIQNYDKEIQQRREMLEEVQKEYRERLAVVEKQKAEYLDQIKKDAKLDHLSVEMDESGEYLIGSVPNLAPLSHELAKQQLQAQGQA